MKNSSVHTGANTQSGGLNHGFASARYQLCTLLAVAAPPRAETTTGQPAAMASSVVSPKGS